MEKYATEVYCVKYCLTKGIFKVAGEVKDRGWFMSRSELGWYNSLSEKEWDHTLEGAQAKAEVLRQKRITSLKKSLAKMETLEIEIKP